MNSSVNSSASTPEPSDQPPEPSDQPKRPKSKPAFQHNRTGKATSFLQ